MKCNAGWFYDELKDALLYLGLSWGDMALMTIKTDMRSITFSGNGRSITIEVCPE